MSIYVHAMLTWHKLSHIVAVGGNPVILETQHYGSQELI